MIHLTCTASCSHLGAHAAGQSSAGRAAFVAGFAYYEAGRYGLYGNAGSAAYLRSAALCVRVVVLRACLTMLACAYVCTDA
jgi:hypothetical protein